MLNVSQVLAAALDLPEKDRVKLLKFLIASVSPTDQPPFDESWREVVLRRSAELDPEGASAVPWAEVKLATRHALGG